MLKSVSSADDVACDVTGVLHGHQLSSAGYPPQQACVDSVTPDFCMWNTFQTSDVWFHLREHRCVFLVVKTRGSQPREQERSPIDQ